MLLTITTTLRPATDLGYLLHKSPGRVHEVELPFGKARVFYTEATPDRCTAALAVDVDPIGLVRKPSDASESGPLVAYVNDRPYVASSMLATALTKCFGTAMGGRSRERAALAEEAIPLEVRIPAVPCRGGASLAAAMFEPLGYYVTTDVIPLDEAFPAWGDSRYVALTLKGTVRLADMLGHLYVLLPVLDDSKHYWVGTDEVEKLVRKGSGWLESHPMRSTILSRALRRRKRFIQLALDRLTEVDAQGADDAPDEYSAEDELERPISLNEQRLGAVSAAIRACGAKSVLDLGCGEGNLISQLIQEPGIDRILGIDVSFRSVEAAKKKFERLPARQQARLELAQGSLLYRDERLLHWDAAALVEVVEHIEPDRLRWLEDSVFGYAKPATIVVTTPNREYNRRFAMTPGTFRHPDHRFEWARDEFVAWCRATAAEHEYNVRFVSIGNDDPELGPPTQMAVFEKWN
ncbi:MAG: 3' terminal RNA ribose 2'-O-methyltransferase Hen1 [Dehalococcoidia bacterium]